MEQGRFILYTREKCPLCIKAKQVLNEVEAKYGVVYREVDIHSDDALVEKYGLMIPVIEWDGAVIQYGKVDASVLEAVLKK